MARVAVANSGAQLRSEVGACDGSSRHSAEPAGAYALFAGPGGTSANSDNEPSHSHSLDFNGWAMNLFPANTHVN